MQHVSSSSPVTDKYHPRPLCVSSVCANSFYQIIPGTIPVVWYNIIVTRHGIHFHQRWRIIFALPPVVVMWKYLINIIHQRRRIFTISLLLRSSRKNRIRIIVRWRTTLQRIISRTSPQWLRPIVFHCVFLLTPHKGQIIIFIAVHRHEYSMWYYITIVIRQRDDINKHYH